ncbi:DUF637 domain-containing protein [Pseudomonas sp. CR3202]|uniref:DUF637 domain-containing protein n=1 Tax=Pseudomonas sp. CR3202 TaxID=3351532 RepID=UPI003BF23083
MKINLSPFGLSSAAGTGAASLVSNRGELGETLKDVTSKDSLKAYATAALIAGFSAGVTDGWGRELTTEGSYKVDFGGRLKAYMANTALKGMLSGENKDAWLSIAATGALMELYQYSVGRGPDIRPGVDREGGEKFEALEGGLVPLALKDGIVREGKNIGLNQSCESFLAICHGTPISNAVNLVPGMNSFATLHDTWMNMVEAAKRAEWQALGAIGVPPEMNVLENIGTMPPALILNYGALYDRYRILIEAERESANK